MPPTGQHPQRAVDLDLDELSPPTRTFRKNGVVYELPGEIPIPLIIRALQIMGTLEGESTLDEATEAFNDMYEIVLDLVRELNPDVGTIPLGTGEVQTLMGLVVGGAPGANLPEAVLETLRNDGAETGKDGKVDKLPPTPRKTRKPTAKKKTSGTRSARRSPVRS